jgi:hypothetical protein
MARDYKNTATKSKAKPRAPGSWMSFISGLGLGLVVAVGVYFLGGGLITPGQSTNRPAETEVEETVALSGLNFEAEMERALPKREFDFYKILPEMEIKVPDWEISSPERKETSEFGQGTYVLQVGSFKQHADADRAKAELALRGIRAKIHRVVINGQDVWYRVHVGPYSDLTSIRAMRAKLIESGNDFILLEIGDGAG